VRPVRMGLPHREQQGQGRLSAVAFVVATLVLLGVMTAWYRSQAVEKDSEDEEIEGVSSDVPPEPSALSEQEPSVEQNTTTGTLLDYLEHGGSMGNVSTKGQPAVHPRGVLYQGPWQHPADGFQEHTRRGARALSMAGVPVHLRALVPTICMTANGSDEEAVEKSVEDLLHASISRYSVMVQQVVPSATLLERLTSRGHLAAQVLSDEEWARQNKARVLYTVYERWPIPANEAKPLSRVGQVWVACERDAKSLREAGIAPEAIRVIPVCYLPNDPILGLRHRKREGGVPRFYHIGKWEPRKASDRVIGAFMRAFRPGESKLYIKTSLARFKFDGFQDTPEDSVAANLLESEVKKNGWTESNWSDSITLQTGWMPLSEIHKIHEWGDVYATLSRGEGFDMPAFDSKLAGNRMVYTPSGGPQDFADGRDVIVNPSGEVSCHLAYGWGAEAKYLDYQMDDAVESFRAAARAVNESRGHEDVSPVEATKLVEFSAQRVGERMRQALQDLIGPEGKLVES